MVQHPFRVRWEVMDDWTWATYLKLGLVAVSLPTLLSGYFIDAIPAHWGIYAGFAMSVVALVINEGFADPEFWEVGRSSRMRTRARTCAHVCTRAHTLMHTRAPAHTLMHTRAPAAHLKPVLLVEGPPAALRRARAGAGRGRG